MVGKPTKNILLGQFVLVILLFMVVSFFLNHQNLPLKNFPSTYLSTESNSTPSRTLGESTTTNSKPTPAEVNAVRPVVPVKNQVSFGVVVDDFMNRTGTLSSLQNKLGTKIKTISIFKQFGNPDNKDFPISELRYAKNQGMKVQLAWEPWNPEQGLNQTTDYLKQITSGTQDDYIRNFARSIKNYGSPVTLRFGHEMNGDWYPWGNRPEDYKAAYRYIYNLFSTEKVANVTWMWCINIDSDETTINSLYPGSDVVNVIGIDGFNFGTTQDYGGWRTFSNLFGSTYQILIKNYSKPIIIAETASTEYGGNKALWVSNMLNSELPKQFPQVKELVWFNLLKETDWRVDSSTSSLRSFQSYFRQ